MFSTLLENFLPSSPNLELPSAKSLVLEESKTCRLRKAFNKIGLVSEVWRKTVVALVVSVDS